MQVFNFICVYLFILATSQVQLFFNILYGTQSIFPQIFVAIDAVVGAFLCLIALAGAQQGGCAA
ncbi:unnamed protein product [Ectocarpus sp. CCAP 1310/34]|nr:unnamed protein product [Ectocarpus sp. CCAP 1310/34]